MTDPDTTEPTPEDDVQGHDANDEADETPDTDEPDKPDDGDTEGHLARWSDATIKYDIQPLS